MHGSKKGIEYETYQNRGEPLFPTVGNTLLAVLGLHFPLGGGYREGAFPCGGCPSPLWGVNKKKWRRQM